MSTVRYCYLCIFSTLYPLIGRSTEYVLIYDVGHVKPARSTDSTKHISGIYIGSWYTLQDTGVAHRVNHNTKSLPEVAFR